MVLQQASDFDGALRRIAGIGIDQLVNSVAKCAGNGLDDLFRAARPFVAVAPAFRADPPFEGIETMTVAQCHQPFGLVCGRDVATHRAGIGAQFSRLAAKQADHRQALDPAPEIPQCGIEPGHGAAEIGARIFVLALADQLQRIGKVQRIGAQCMRGDLAVEDLAGNVGIIGGDLSPALMAAVGRYPDKADEFVAKGFEPADFHGGNRVLASIGPLT